METLVLPPELDPDASEAGGEEPPRIAARLLDELGHLDEGEHEALADLIARGRRDRDRNGPLDELGLLINALKSHPTDDNSVFMKLAEKVGPEVVTTYPEAERIPLETDLIEFTATLPEILAVRRSRRSYAGTPLSLKELGSLLYYAYGSKGAAPAYNRADVPMRQVPTGGGLQSVELYVVVNAVEGLDQGLYHYHPVRNELECLERGLFRYKVTEIFPNAAWLSESSVVVFLAPKISRLSWKYGRRAYRLAHVDTGVLAQNLHLVATGLRLRSCVLLGFLDDPADDLLNLDGREQTTTCAIAIGRHPNEDRPNERAAETPWSYGAPG
jgi:SagB-type dehydrogenase family enzyme